MSIKSPVQRGRPSSTPVSSTAAHATDHVSFAVKMYRNTKLGKALVDSVETLQEVWVNFMFVFLVSRRANLAIVWRTFFYPHSTRHRLRQSKHEHLIVILNFACVNSFVFLFISRVQAERM